MTPHRKKMSSRGAFQCTTWLVWNKFAASKTLLWRRQKKFVGVAGLLGRVILYTIFVALPISKPSKNSLNITNLLSCNSKGLILDFYLNRKRSKCWLAAYSCWPIYISFQYRNTSCSWTITQLCQLYYKYWGIARQRLSVVFLQNAG